MTASEHLSPLQLQMFMPAGQVKAMGNPLDAQGGDPEPMWEEKLEQAQEPGSAANTWHPTGHGPSLEDSVRRSGVSDPINLSHDVNCPPRLTQGHHRVAAADHVDPTMELPIRHVGDRRITQREWVHRGGGHWSVVPPT